MKKYTYILTIILASIFMASCGSDDKKILADNSPIINVKVDKVSVNKRGSFLSASGKIQSVYNADLSTRIMGFVTQVHVNVGDKVSKGQRLISINNVDLQAKQAQANASITEATAAFINAEKDFTRFKNLFKNNSASQKELDDITANYEMAKARLEAANQIKNEVNAQFAYANISAPFNGIITGKFVKKGDITHMGAPLISIETPNAFEVVAMIPENEISKIKKGTKVDILAKSIDEALKGKVTEISTSAKNTGGQYLTKIALDKTNANILSGMFVTVLFPFENPEQIEMVLIPKNAIVNKGQLSGVYTVSQNNTALLRWLRLGKTYGDSIEVLSGLSTNESYIVSADGKLFNGAKISIQ
ncbi:efflux RND transporter periplasmic adaptor subunit [uncultured Algibacter sp.]|uniref:efflux RND transporter periplasmic adaptor subunit n=1 Tax=uncultured Algibacter sp. TaxID=298659 RepID=UPI00262A41EB|nr:efflux RND transporter periplasmic adaptor subunit [uncultured Algibacter sp.]